MIRTARLDRTVDLAATKLDVTGATTSAAYLQAQIDTKAPIASPTFTGTVVIPTPFTLGAVSVLPTGTELNFVDGVTSPIQAQLDAKAPLASPALTGNPTAPTATPGDNDTSIATTAFVAAAVTAGTGALTASDIANTPAGGIAATNVQAAIDELDTEKAALAGATFTGDVVLSASTFLGGKFDGTHSARTLFRTTTANTGTSFGFVPNGTSDNSQINMYSDSAATNATMNQLVTTAGTYVFRANKLGTGAYAPITFETSGSERLKVGLTGTVTASAPTGGLGYGAGAGGAVTQITSRTTGVTLNTVCGAITLVSAAGSATWQTFTVTNSAVEATDVPKVVQKSGTDLYMVHVTAVAAGSFNISFATTGGTTTEQPVFNFSVIKAVAA